MILLKFDNSSYINLNYDSYKIIDSMISIKGIQLPQDLSLYDKIQVDLTQINAQTPNGKAIDNPFFNASLNTYWKNIMNQATNQMDIASILTQFFLKNS